MKKGNQYKYWCIFFHLLLEEEKSGFDGDDSSIPHQDKHDHLVHGMDLLDGAIVWHILVFEMDTIPLVHHQLDSS